MVPCSEVQPARACPERGQPMAMSKLSKAMVPRSSLMSRSSLRARNSTSLTVAVPDQVGWRQTPPMLTSSAMVPDASPTCSGSPHWNRRGEIWPLTLPSIAPGSQWSSASRPEARASLPFSVESTTSVSRIHCGVTSTRPDGTTSVSLPSRPRGTSSAGPLPPPILTEPVMSGRLRSPEMVSSTLAGPWVCSNRPRKKYSSSSRSMSPFM